MKVWNGTVFVVWIAGPFLARGTWVWPAGWRYLLVLGLGLLVHGRWVRHRNPELVAARRTIGPGSQRWDLAWNLAFWPLMAAEPVAAGIEARSMPPASLTVAVLGAVIVWSGLALSAWAMSVNPHFEGTVRIQRERGHRVIDTGPYRAVRHPGYLGLVLWALGTPPLLGSTWAVVPAVVVAAWIVLRTALEDRFLARELEGYAAYAARVRARLVPGLW